VFSSLFRKSVQKVKKDWREKQVSDKEFHAALKLCHEILIVVKSMASCSGPDEQSDKNRKNALILKSHIFKHDLVKIIRFCFCMFKPMQHNKQFLIDAATFNHEFLASLEDYSRGRVFTVATG
jgi:hypothetical protein